MTTGTMAHTQDTHKDSLVQCDECSFKFKPAAQIQKLGKDAFLDYFLCPKCETRYNVSVITEKGIRFRNRIKLHFSQGKGDFPGYKRLLMRLQKEMRKPKVQVIPGKQKPSDTAS